MCVHSITRAKVMWLLFNLCSDNVPTLPEPRGRYCSMNYWKCLLSVIQWCSGWRKEQNHDVVISLFHSSQKQMIGLESFQCCSASFMSNLTIYFKSSTEEWLCCVKSLHHTQCYYCLALEDFDVSSWHLWCAFMLFDYFRAWQLWSLWNVIVKNSINIPRILCL